MDQVLDLMDKKMNHQIQLPAIKNNSKKILGSVELNGHWEDRDTYKYTFKPIKKKFNWNYLFLALLLVVLPFLLFPDFFISLFTK